MITNSFLRKWKCKSRKFNGKLNYENLKSIMNKLQQPGYFIIIFNDLIRIRQNKREHKNKMSKPLNADNLLVICMTFNKILGWTDTTSCLKFLLRFTSNSP